MSKQAQPFHLWEPTQPTRQPVSISQPVVRLNHPSTEQSSGPGWARDIPDNVGVPTCRKPYRCSVCTTAIFRWNGTQWVCWHCKYHAVTYDRDDGDLTTLEGCRPTGIY